MIEKLRKYFPSLIHYESMPTEINRELKWFMSGDGQVIGIHPTELEEKDELLLYTFLKPYQNNFPIVTEQEQLWKQWIQLEEGHPEINDAFRFVFFQFPAKQIVPHAFKEAINQLYEKDVTILWESESEGIIVDIANKGNVDESISYKEIIDVLMSDLYVKIRFFVGPYHHSLDNVNHYYYRIISGAKIAFTYLEENVISYIDAIPSILIHQADHSFKEELQQLILQEFQNDTEFINMIQVLLDCNLNISVAAKRLYMHRNSLQYRIDKFYEKTGIDIRIFHHALTVYLALLANH